MIEKERLKELIEQGATIYELYMNKNILEIQLKNDWFVINDGLYERKLSKHPFRSWWISNLYETKEEAEWHKEFDCIERTERFEPLYYNDIDQNYCYDYHFSTKNYHEYLIRVSGKDIILFWTDCNYKEYFKNTKEEYEKLIRRCAKMFLEGDYAK